MADGFSATVDSAALQAALLRLGDTAVKYTKPASKVSADSMQREMQSRIARATGKTSDNILVTEFGDGYIVATSDVRIFGVSTPTPGHPGGESDYFQELHVGLWLEKGIRKGGKSRGHTAAAQPWFFPSIALEEGPHEQRIQDAVTAAIAAEGLGA